MSERKPRCDARLLQLPEDARDRLYEAIEKDGYLPATKQCLRLTGVRSSTGALHNFYKRETARRQKAKFLKASALADAVQQNAAKDFSPEFATLLANTAMEMHVAGQQELATEILNMALAIKKDLREAGEFHLSQQRFQRETLRLFVQWSADAKARELAEAAAKSGDDADKTELLGRHLFGEDWRS